MYIPTVFITELALYALDVYYNQTYLNRIDNKNDHYNQNQQYYDYYQQTFRSQEDHGFLKHIGKIPEWLTLAYEL